MRIYVSHSRQFDYEKELYTPLREWGLSSKFQFFLPHEGGASSNSKELIKNSNLVLAEVSFPSTGQGIELGWAECLNIPILCMYRTSAELQVALKFIASDFIPYTNEYDFIAKLKAFLPEK